MSGTPIYIAIRPSIFRVGLLKVLGEADHVQPLPWEERREREAAARHVAILDARGRPWEAALMELERGGVFPHRVLIARTVRDATEAADLLALGVAGCTSATDTPESLLEKVTAVAEGDWRRSRRDLLDVVRRVERAEAEMPPLSRNEVETLSLVARGFSNRRIAGQLSLAEGTVRNRVSMLYGRIGVGSRGEAIIWAWQHGVGSHQSGGDLGS